MKKSKNYQESPLTPKGFAAKKMRWHVLYDLIVKGNYTKCLEIGTASGLTAHNILLNTKGVTWTSIDPYVSYEEYIDGKNHPKKMIRMRRQAYENLGPFGQRWRHIEKFSSEAVAEIDDDYDLIFIDGNHTYDFIKSDLRLFYPKVRAGGVFSGHDYRHGSLHPGVKKAVDEFVKEKQLKLCLRANHVWFIRK